MTRDDLDRPEHMGATQTMDRFMEKTGGGFVFLLVVVAIGLACNTAAAQERVPLTANFSPVELTTTSIGIGLGPAVLLLGPRIFDGGLTTLNTPDGTLDYRISDNFHGPLETGDRMALGLSDPLLLTLPWVGALYMGTSAAWFGITRRPLLAGQTVNIDHLAFTYFEALGWTAFTVGATRMLLRRPRPWVELDRPQFARETIEPTTSFASSHTALGATAAMVLSRSLWDQMHNQPTLVRLLPQVALYGFLAFASVAHVHDQENFVTDELAGLAIGTAFGHLAYSLHFDRDGQPRSR